MPTSACASAGSSNHKRAIEVLVLDDDHYTLLGTFTGDEPVRSRVLTKLAIAAWRFSLIYSWLTAPGMSNTSIRK